jgi:hypothetical protein
MTRTALPPTPRAVAAHVPEPAPSAEEVEAARERLSRVVLRALIALEQGGNTPAAAAHEEAGDYPTDSK